MTYKRFEDLPVWQSAENLAVAIDELVQFRVFRRPGDLADQLCRASLSVANNIAEGFERGTTNELLSFLYIARGSAGECRSMLRHTVRLLPQTKLTPTESTSLQTQLNTLIQDAEAISRQLRAWADSLQNSDIKGPRHLNDNVRTTYNQQRRANAFREKLRGTLDIHKNGFDT